mgnify:CR=1 FL=1
MTDFERMDRETEKALFKISQDSCQFILDRLPEKSIEKYSRPNLLLNSLTGSLSVMAYSLFPKEYREAFLEQLVRQMRANFEFQDSNVTRN